MFKSLIKNQMKVDFYTKAVLTVIAVCLVIIVLTEVDILSKAHAAPRANYGLVPLNEDGSINVRFDSGEIIDVNIEQVGGFSTFGTIPVEVE